MRCLRGQSTVEFAVGAATLALLLMGTLALGGYQEVDRRGALAARQSAWLDSWERGRGTEGNRAQALHRELLGDSGVLEATGRSLLVAEEGVTTGSGVSRPTGVAGGVGRLLLAPLEVVGGFLGNGFDLEDRGLVRGHIGLRLESQARLPEPFRDLELELHASYALLADAWHAGGPSHVRERAGGLVPTARLAAINSLWRPLSTPLAIIEPSLGQLCPGLIEPDRIPEDRLGPGRTPLPGRCP